MEMEFILSVSLIFVPLLFYIFIRKRNSRNSKIPISPPKLPIIGNLHQVAGTYLPHHGLHKLAQKYGPIFSLKLGQVNTIVISSPTILKEIVLKHDQNFSNRPLLISNKEASYNFKDMSFTPYGPYFNQIRKICSHGMLSSKRVKSFHTIREEQVDHLMDEIYGAATQGLNINLTKKVHKLTNEIVCKAALGKVGGNERLLKGIRDSMDLSSGLNVADFFPSLEFVNVLTGVQSKMSRASHQLDEFFNEMLEDHRARMNDGTDDGQDLVDVMLRAQKEQLNSGEEVLTDSSIKGIIRNIFLGGTDTTSTTVTWAMSELMKNSRVMKEAQDEVRSAFEGKRKIGEIDIEKLIYIKLVIKETLRLHPPAPLLSPREAINSCTVSGHHIPAKRRIIVNSWAISRDPKYWVDAEEFQPERFKENGRDFLGQHMEYTPFGWGRRGCPGMNFGVAIVEIVLAQLLAFFNWSLPDGMKPEDLNMEEKFGSVSTRKDDLCLVAIPFAPRAD